MTDASNVPPDLASMTPEARENFSRLSFDMATFTAMTPAEPPKEVRAADGTFTPAPPTADQYRDFTPALDRGVTNGLRPDHLQTSTREIVELGVALDLPANVFKGVIENEIQRANRFAKMSEVDRTIQLQSEKSFYTAEEKTLAEKATERAAKNPFLQALIVAVKVPSPYFIKQLAMFEARRGQ